MFRVALATDDTVTLEGAAPDVAATGFWGGKMVSEVWARDLLRIPELAPQSGECPARLGDLRAAIMRKKCVLSETAARQPTGRSFTATKRAKVCWRSPTDGRPSVRPRARLRHCGDSEQWSPDVALANSEDSMRFRRRQFLYLAAYGTVLPAVSRTAMAQNYPIKPVRVIVGFAPGGPNDIHGRLIAQWLSERFGQPFVVENRPGASGNIGVEAVVRSQADGYTLLIVSNTDTINATLYDNLNFNFVRDIAPVAGMYRNGFILEVHPSLQARTVPELIAYARANPGSLICASAGTGTPQHASSELFKMMTGIAMLHVPYRGEALALADMISGQAQVMFGGMTSSIQHIRSGRLRALAVTTAARSVVLPDLPTVGEFVPGYETSGWIGVGAPKTTPTEIIDILNREINAGLSSPTIKGRYADLEI